MNDMLTVVETESSDPTAKGASTRRVLLVEANEDRASQMRHVLMEAGYPEMSWVNNFDAAYEALSLEKIDLIIVAEDVGEEAGIELI